MVSSRKDTDRIVGAQAAAAAATISSGLLAVGKAVATSWYVITPAANVVGVFMCAYIPAALVIHADPGIHAAQVPACICLANGRHP